MIIRRITILLVCANLTAGFLTAAGAPAVLGIEPHTGIDDDVQHANESASSISDNLGIISSIVGLTITVVDTLVEIARLPFAAPTLALNLGVPQFIVAFVFGPLYIAVGIDLLSVARGMEIV